MKDNRYYENYVSRTDNSLKNFKNDLSDQNIKSDFYLIIILLKELFLYFILFIPRLFLLIFFLFFNSTKSKNYFNLIVIEPFKLIKLIINWFFEARITAYLSIFLVLIFFFQIFVLEKYFNINNFVYSFYDLLGGNYYSIVTSIFLHANLPHLFGNLLFLNIFGRIVEKHFKFNMFWIFLSSGIIANLVSGYFYYLASDHTPALGASGGIAGLIFLSILLEPLTLTMGLIIPLPLFIVGWLGILNDILAYLYVSNSNVNRLAHLSGYLSLIILMFFFNIKNRKKVLIGLLLNFILLVILFYIIQNIGFGNIKDLILN